MTRYSPLLLTYFAVTGGCDHNRSPHAGSRAARPEGPQILVTKTTVLPAEHMTFEIVGFRSRVETDGDCAAEARFVFCRINGEACVEPLSMAAQLDCGIPYIELGPGEGDIPVPSVPGFYRLVLTDEATSRKIYSPTIEVRTPE